MTKNYLHLILFCLVTLIAVEIVHAEKLAPEVIPGAHTISTGTAKILLDQGYPFVDVRGQSDYDKGHLPGAYHLPVKSNEFTPENLNKISARNQAIIFYCNGVTCMGSTMATEQALQWGWQKIFYYRDGFKGWQEAGY